MALRSLLFSSDEGTAYALGEALKELNMQVEHCPEIFAAIEKLTLQSFDVIVVDWDDEPEASFLLNAAHELKANGTPFAVAVVADAGAVATAQHAGANHVLVKDGANAAIWDYFPGFRVCPEALPIVEETQSGLTGHETPGSYGSRVDRYLGKMAASGASGRYTPAKDQPSSRGKKRKRKFLQKPVVRKDVQRSIRPYQGMLMAVLVLGGLVSSWSLGYRPGAAVERFAAQARVREAWEELKTRLISSEADAPGGHAAGPKPAVEMITVSSPHSRQKVMPIARAFETPEEAPSMPESPLPALLAAAQPATGGVGTAIPDSLRFPFDSAAARSVAARVTPTLLGALEPLALPEEISRKLLMQAISPIYPVAAVRQGLQGPVVLQARVGRDGKIRDLKLVRGYLVLGRAAFEAVKQWRYQPYFLNGQAMETETYVTVNFKLSWPSSSQSQAQ